MELPIPAWMPPAWQTYLQKNRHSPQPSNDIHQDLFNSDLMPLQRSAELSKAIALIRQEIKNGPEVFMEIGADRCTTVYHWLRAFPTIRKMIAVEIRGCPMAKIFEQFFPAVEFLWLAESSYAPEAVAKVNQFLCADAIDTLFIDGDKNHFDTDFHHYRPLLSTEGLVLMHDVFDKDSPMQAAFLRESAIYSRRGVIIDTSEGDRLQELIISGRYPDIPSSYQDWLRHWSHSSCGFGWMHMGSYQE